MPYTLLRTHSRVFVICQHYHPKHTCDEQVPSHTFPPPGPQEAISFTSHLAALCERHCETLRDFTGERGDWVALDLGCAVGGASFELARAFPHVLGIDYSKHFVEAAEVSAE